jgi:hypothetical protein
MLIPIEHCLHTRQYIGCWYHVLGYRVLDRLLFSEITVQKHQVLFLSAVYAYTCLPQSLTLTSVDACFLGQYLSLCVSLPLSFTALGCSGILGVSLLFLIPVSTGHSESQGFPPRELLSDLHSLTRAFRMYFSCRGLEKWCMCLDRIRLGVGSGHIEPFWPHPARNIPTECLLRQSNPSFCRKCPFRRCD